MPISHYRWYIPWLEFYLAVEPFHRSPISTELFTLQAMYIAVIGFLQKHPCPSTTIQDFYATLCYLVLTFCPRITSKETESQPYVHHGP